MDTSQSSSSRFNKSIAVGPGATGSFAIHMARPKPVIHPDYDIIYSEPFEELDGLATIYQLRGNGPLVLNISNSDHLCAFGDAYFTPPTCRKGLPHTTEHMTYRGSKKFNALEPFVRTEKASFLFDCNGITDFDVTTYYHIGSHPKSFLNMIELTLDALNNPLDTEAAFREEVWRVAPDREANNELRILGVVPSELKGSDLDSAHLKFVVQNLFPDTYLVYDSGGELRFIPDTTNADIRAYRQRFYLRNAARIFVLGNLDIKPVLDMTAQYYGTEPSPPPAFSVAYQTPFPAPRQAECYYAGGETESARGDSAVSVNYALGRKRDIQLLPWKLLDMIINDENSGPIADALFDDKLGEGFVAGGFNSTLPQPTFTFGLSGTWPAKAEQIQDKIHQTLKRLAVAGVPKLLITRALAQYEELEHTQRKSPRDRENLIYRVFEQWHHTDDPLKDLSWKRELREIKLRLRRGERIFEPLIQELVDSNHQVTITAKPKKSLSIDTKLSFRKRVDQWIENGEVENFMFKDAGKRDTEASLSCLNTLSNEDWPEMTKRPEFTLAHNGRVHQIAADTEKRVYINIAFNIRHLPAEIIPIAAILADCLMGTGTSRLSPQQFVGQLGNIGEVESSIAIDLLPDGKEHIARMVFQANCRRQHARAMLQFLRDGLLDARLDNMDRFLHLIGRQKATIEGEIQAQGSAFAMDRAAAHLRVGHAMDEQSDGISYILTLRDFEAKAKRSWASVRDMLIDTYQKVIANADVRIGVVAEPEDLDRVSENAIEFFQSTCTEPVNNLPMWDCPVFPQREGFTVSGSANYVGQALDLGNVGYKYHASLRVALNYLVHDYLWDQGRRAGGAYGVRAHYDSHSSILTLGAFRDSNVVDPLMVFATLPKALNSRVLNTYEIKSSMIGAASTQYPDEAINEVGLNMFLEHLRGTDKDDYRRDWDEIQETRPVHCRELGEVIEAAFKSTDSIVILGERQALERADTLKGGNWLTIKPLE